MLLVWLVLSSITVLLLLVLVSNNANLSQSPGVAARLKIFLTTHRAEIKQQALLPELESPKFNLSAEQLFEKLPAVIQSLGWEIKLTDSTNYLYEVVVSTPLFGFKDDIDISILDDGGGCYLYADSRSRVGRADFAANSHHLQQLLAQLQIIKDAASPINR